MADIVNRGTMPNDQIADTLYDAFGKVNTAFANQSTAIDAVQYKTQGLPNIYKHDVSQGNLTLSSEFDGVEFSGIGSDITVTVNDNKSYWIANNSFAAASFSTLTSTASLSVAAGVREWLLTKSNLSPIFLFSLNGMTGGGGGEPPVESVIPQIVQSSFYQQNTTSVTVTMPGTMTVGNTLIVKIIGPAALQGVYSPGFQNLPFATVAQYEGAIVFYRVVTPDIVNSSFVFTGWMHSGGGFNYSFAAFEVNGNVSLEKFDGQLSINDFNICTANLSYGASNSLTIVSFHFDSRATDINAVSPAIALDGRIWLSTNGTGFHNGICTRAAEGTYPATLAAYSASRPDNASSYLQLNVYRA